MKLEAGRIRILVERVFTDCDELSRLTGRPVSPDGHLVGSIGEVLAAAALNLTLEPPSNKGYDATDDQGRKVEIKCTTRRTVALSAAGTEAERLVVLTLSPRGEATIVYDGAAATAWDLAGPAQKNGQRALPLRRLQGSAETRLGG